MNNISDNKNGNGNNNKRALKVNCVRCKASVTVKYIDGERDYSKKNNWDYWTESSVDKKKPRYLCDECLLELFYRYKKEFRQWVKNKKKQNLLAVYINEGLIGVKKPFFIPE